MENNCDRINSPKTLAWLFHLDAFAYIETANVKTQTNVRKQHAIIPHIYLWLRLKTCLQLMAGIYC